MFFGSKPGNTAVIAAAVIAAIRLAREDRIQNTSKVVAAIGDSLSLANQIYDRVVKAFPESSKVEREQNQKSDISETKDRMAGEAVMLRMWSHAVGIVNEKRRVDTLSGGRTLHQEQTGSACLVRWKGHHCILTAKHVIENAGIGDLRFFFRPENIERKTREEIERQGFVEFHKGLRADIREIFRCGWEDVAILTVNPETRGLNGEFHDFEQAWRDPAEGATVHCLGFPSHKPIDVVLTRSPDREEHILALAPVAWSNTVIAKPVSLVEPLSADLPYDPEKHFLIEWKVDDASMGMYGFSGGATWTDDLIPKTELWSPKLFYSGICTHYYSGIKVGRVIKASVVKTFLEEVLSPIQF